MFAKITENHVTRSFFSIELQLDFSLNQKSDTYFPVS